MSLFAGYFAAPFVLRVDDGYVAHGTHPERSDGGDGRVMHAHHIVVEEDGPRVDGPIGPAASSDEFPS